MAASRRVARSELDRRAAALRRQIRRLKAAEAEALDVCQRTRVPRVAKRNALRAEAAASARRQLENALRDVLRRRAARRLTKGKR